MKKQAGVWIDAKEAMIVILDGESHTEKIINSSIDSRVRIDGEGKQYTRMGDQFMDPGKKKEAKKEQEKYSYIKDVAEEIITADELVLFGPANMKNELAKYIREDLRKESLITAVKTTDSMTGNQKVAWVKKFYNN